MNPKTGKQIPGHVTKEGFKINDGDCPFYALLKLKGDAKEAKAVPTDVPSKATPEPAKTKVTKSPQSLTPASGDKLGFSVNGDSIFVTLGACSVQLSKQDAIKVCRDLLNLIN